MRPVPVSFAAGAFLCLVAASSLHAQTGMISGKVTAEGTGQPIAGITVQVEVRNGPFVGQGVTDGNGDYFVASLGNATYVVRALSGAGFVGELWDGVNEFDYDLATSVVIDTGETETGKDFALAVAGSISGTIVSGLTPGQSANLRVEDAFSRRYRGGTNSDPNTFAYTIAQLPPGSYRVRVDPWGTDRAFQYWNGKTRFSQADSVPVALGEAVVGKDFNLVQAGSISGTLMLSPAAGSPVNMWVEALDATTGEWVQSVGVTFDSTTGYLISNLPAGSWVVRVNTGGGLYVREFYSSVAQDIYQFSQATPVSVTAGGTTGAVDLTLELGRTISGRVFLDDGDNVDEGEPGVPDAHVNANLEVCCFGSGTRTDANGNYTIQGLRPGRYFVEAQSTSPSNAFVEERYNNHTRILDDARDPVDVSLGDQPGIDFGVLAGQLISGTVFQDLNGNGLRDAGEPAVSGGSVRASDSLTGRCCSHTQIGAGGAYGLAVPAGTYRVDASSGGLLREYWNSDPAIDAFFFANGSPIATPQSGIDFSMLSAAAFGTLRGEVRAPGTGLPVPGVNVRVQLWSTSSDVGGGQTGVDGRFVISGLPPAEYKILFDTQSSNPTNNQDLVAEYWTRCQTQSCPPGVIDPNDQKVVFPATPAPPDGPGADVGAFSLTQGGSIEGVVDIVGGGALPLPFNVQIQSFVSGGPSQPFLPGAGVLSDGSYKIRGVPAPQTYKVQASTFGTDYVAVYYQTATTSTFDNTLAGPVDVSVGVATTGIDLHLYRGGSISGRVTCASGATPVANYPVQVDRISSGGFGVRPRTDANGFYVGRGLPSGQYTVRADARGETFGSCGSLANETYPGQVTVTEGSDTPNVDFDLAAGTTISGRVTQIVDGQTQPVVNIRVSASDYATGQFVSDNSTNTNGDYAIGGLTAGVSYRVKVETRDRPDDPQFFNFVLEYFDNTIFFNEATGVAAPATGKDFLLDLGGAISGTVTADGIGSPLSGVNVCADIFSGGGSNTCDRTDQNGFYVIRGLPADNWRVRANTFPQNYVSEYYDNTVLFNAATPVPVAAVPAGGPVPITANVNFSLAAGSTIQGRIFFDADGDGVQAVSGEPGLGSICVNAQSVDGLFGFGGACSGGNGDYTFVGLPAGSYTLNVLPTGTAYAGEFFKLVDGKAVGTTDRLQAQAVTTPASGIDFSLVLGGAVKGVVRAFGGGPLANVQINANPFTGQGLGAGATSDSAGNYRIDGLPAGQYRVQARDNNGVYVFEFHSSTSPDAFFSDQATSVSVTAGGETTIDFDLVLGGAIEGDVYDDANSNLTKDDGEAVVNANITVSEFAAPNRCCLGSGNTRTDSNGHFRVGGLPPGMNLRVQASPPAGSDLVSVFYDGGDDKGTISASSAASVSVTAGGTFSPVNFALERGGAIEGVVYFDADGDGFQDPGEAGLQGVNINVSTATFCCFGQDRQTDGNGHFRVRGIPAGSYRVQANPPGSTDYVAIFHDGGNDQGALVSNNALLVAVSSSSTVPVNFGLNLGASIAGAVYQDLNDSGLRDGEPGVVNVPINVNVKVGTQFFCCFGNGNRNTDSTGAFLIRGVPAATAAGPAEIRLQVNASPTNNPSDLISIWWDGGDDKGPTVQSLATSLFPNPGDQLTGFNFALTLGGSISGFLRDGNGDPIPNFCCLNAGSLVTNVSGRSSLTTSSTGAYTIRGLTPGPYRVDSGTPAGFTREWWDNQFDQLAADPVAVQSPASCGTSGLTGCITSGIDFHLTKRPQLVSGLTQTSGAQGTTLTGVQFTASASSLLGGACGAAPCSRVDVGGTGVTVQNLSLNSGVFTFDLVIAAGAPLGFRSVSIVNDYTLAGEDSALVIPNALEVTAGGAPFDSPEQLYATDLDLGQLRIYGASDSALLGRIDVCCDPGAVALQGNRLAYVAGSDRSLAVVDLQLGKEVFRTTSVGSFGPYAVAATANYIYVLNRESPLNNRVHVFDAVTWEPKGYILVGHSPFPVGANPFALRLDPTGRLWVVNQGATNTPSSVTILDTSVDPANPNVRLATVSFPAGFSPRGVAFGPDFDGGGPRGAYAYVVGAQNTFVLDTAVVLGADPSLAFIDVDGSSATGFAVGSRAGISPIPTRGGGNGVIDVAPLPGDGRTLAYVTEGQQVRVIDLSTNPDQPRFVKTFSAGFFNSNGIRATADGSRVFFSYNATKDLWVLDTANLLANPAVNLTRIDRDRGPGATQALLVGGLTVGAKPTAPGSRPSVLALLPAAAQNGGADFTVTITGSGFDVNVAQNLPVVWLQGTLVRGTVLAGSMATSLQVSFPGHTPSGDHAVIVTNGQLGGNVSSTGSAILQVRAPAGYAPTQNVFVTSFGKNKVFVYGQAAPSDPPAEIGVQPGAGGLALTPDGRAGLISELYSRALSLPTDFWGGDSLSAAVVDLDPSHAGTFRTAVARLPFVGAFFESLAVTPDLADADGVFAYLPNRGISDTVSVLDPASCLADPATCREIDMNPAPGTQTYPNSGDPSVGDLGSRLPAGLNRIELDAQVSNFDKSPTEVAVSPDGSRLYVANLANGGGVSIARASDGFVLGRYTFDGNRADGNVRTVLNLAVSPDGSRLYAAGLDSVLEAAVDNLARPFVYVYDTAVTDENDDNSLVGCFRLPTGPLAGDNAAEFKDIGRGITITPDGTTAYVVARLRGELWVLDLTNESLTCPGPAATIALKGQGVGQHALAGDYLYLANNFKSEVYVYDVSNRLSPQFVTTLGAACAGDVALQPSFSAPVLSAVFPTSGPASGGTPVTLSGHNFVTGADVRFDGVPASDVVVANSYTITAKTPPGVDGPATVRVTNLDFQFSELDGRFRYQSDFDPPVFQTNPPEMMVGPQTLDGACPACTVSVQIEWTTNEASDSLVGYGTTSSLGASQSDPALVTSHSVTLTGLATSTLYHFRVTSRDSVGNAASHPAAPATVAFTTLAQPDTTAPVIVVGPAVSVTHQSALVQWSTNETSSSEVEYGLAGGSLTLVTGGSGAAHSVTLAPLTPNTPYDYRVTSRDSSGNPVSTSVLQFLTAALPDTTPPDPLPLGPGADVTVSYLSNDLVIVTWTTDEPSTSFINYGVSSIEEQGVIDITPVYRHILFLTNLLPGTVYGFQFGSTDAAGNTFLSDDPFGGMLGLQAMSTTRLKQSRRAGVATLQGGTMLTLAAATSGFMTPVAADTTAPVVTVPVAVTVLAFDRVLVTAATDEAASILARYGQGGLSSSAFDTTFAQSQSLVLAGLTGGATYQLEVVLTDPKGNARTVSGLSFTTPSAPDTQAPQVSGVSASSTTETSASVTWTTDEPADASVRYGALGGPLDRSAGSLGFGTSHAVVLGNLTAGTSYAFEVTSRDASGNAASAAGAPFTTAFRSPSISSVIPNKAAQSATATLTISGSALDPDAQVSLGSDVTVDAVSVNPTGTQLLAGVTVSATAATGPRALSVTNPRSGFQAFASFSIVDASVPQVRITEPAGGAVLESPTVLVRGSVSEPSTVTVNGVPAAVAADLSYSATIQLSGAGAHRIVATAIDASGNRGSTAVDVELLFVDTSAPILSLSASPGSLWPPNHQLVPVTVSVSVSDDTDPAPVVVLVSITSSEPDDAQGGGDGNTTNDIQDAQIGTNDRQVQLRAERAGNGPGRVYTLRYRATDQSGNSVEKAVEVRVPHDR